jgi:hypothetical protein
LSEGDPGSSPYEDLGFAKVDHDRKRRKGFPEVIFGQGKTPDQIVAIASAMSARGDNVLVTRVAPEAMDALAAAFPSCERHPVPRLAFIRNAPVAKLGTRVAVLCAGTSDLPVAEEAAVTAELMGNEVDRFYDVGVAGLHRLLDKIEAIRRADAAIAVAGMEGALASVLTGLVDIPVIAVPTSVGYGANLGGLVTALAMLNSCSSGMAVVNIDNGFGAAYLAGTITRGLARRSGRD